MADSPYEIPLLGSSSLMEWCLGAVSEGEAWLSAQRPSIEWQSIIELLSATDPGGDLNGMSNTEYNKAERIARELVAAIGAFRYEGEFKPESDKNLADVAEVLTQLDNAWHRTTYAYGAQRMWLQNGVALGTSYGVCTWDKQLHGPYKGDIRLDAFAPSDVTFLQLPKDHDIQKAYAVIIRYELPINLARRIYGATNMAFAQRLTPDRDSPGWFSRGLEKVQRFLAPALRAAGRRNDQTSSFPTCDIFHMYTCDNTINTSGAPMVLGAYGTNWQYTVPYLGQEQPTSQINPATGDFFTKPATAEDCLLFPLRRLTIFSRSVNFPCYDGSSPWWHGKAPVVRLRFNDWPWEALGRSLVGPIRTLQSGLSAMMRDVEDSVAARLDPPVLYDDQKVSAGFAKDYNPRRAGSRAAADINSGKVLEYPFDPRLYDVGVWIPEWIRQQEGRMDYLTGVQDLSAIAKARQLPSSDALEKLLEMAGPIVQDMVRSIEEPLQQLGELRKAYYFQFYTYPRILQVAGSDGEDMNFDYQPEKLVKLVPNESPQTRRDRAKRYLHEFYYDVAQSGISDINRMTTKLFYLQLMKIPGFPLDWWTFAKIAQIPNFGSEPEGTSNVVERYVAQMRMQAEFAQEMQAGMAQPDIMAQAAGGPGGANGQVGPGRPQTNNKPPQLRTKDGGTRSTVTTS